MSAPPQPRPHQVEALTDLTRALAVHDRTQLVMACGSGKTLVGRWHAQASDAGRILVLVPSLALVAQTLREWRRANGNTATGWRFDALVVCSDPTTSDGAAERSRTDDGDQADVDAPTWEEVRAEVTTDPAAAIRFLRRQQPGRPQVIFSTYHSAHVVAAAQARTRAVFDLAICDEAHRLAGQPRESFRIVLDSRAVVARKRLFMTATPRRFEGEGGISMDDPRLFGPVSHTVTFGEAIDAGLLADYQVLVVAGRAGEHHTDERGPSTVPSALFDAIDSHRITRVLTFHGRVAKAAAFADAVDGTATAGGRMVAARHVCGTMPTSYRTQSLDWLADRASRHVRVISNARCLAEGVDVPAVDAIMFADQRSSVVDIIQAVGRVLRPAPGKTRGTIILPVTLPPDGDDDSSLAVTTFAHVWTVLRGLRAHDQRLGAEIDDVVRRLTHNGHIRGYRVPRIQFLLPRDVDEPALQLRLVQEVGSIWERNHAVLRRWAQDNPGRVLTRGAKIATAGAGSINLGEWAEQQRIAYRRGTLPADRADRLEKVPGWAWDNAQARWDETYEVLAAHARAHRTVADNDRGPSAFEGMYDREAPRRHLGVWMAAQRQAHRLATLPTRKVEALEALPGWDWSAHLPDIDVAMVEALREFVEFEKHARVPDDHTEDGLRLGAWCWAIRRRRFLGYLAPALEDEILAATPSKFRPAERFQWEKAETQWRIGYFALRQYTAREGAATPTGSVHEELPDTSVHLGMWTARQRFAYNRGELDERHAALLEAMPGWVWKVELGDPPREPVELPDGYSHGTASGYGTFKCRCEQCRDWNRAGDRRRLAARRELRHPVAAWRARGHLEGLEAFLSEDSSAGARNGRTTIAEVAGVPLGVIRKVLGGDAEYIESEHDLRIRAVTKAMCQSARNRVGSRGRVVTSGNQRVDPGPTFVLLDDLAERGFGITWVSRELGYAGGLQIRRHRLLSRRIATQVARLHARVGDLVMPALAKSARRPTLAELQSQQHQREAS